MTKKTLGQLLIDTHEQHVKESFTPIESGDLVSEAGKSYMTGLMEAIKNHKKFNIPKLWFMVKIEKESFNTRVIKISIGAMSAPFRYLHDGIDLWSYDYRKDERKLEWSLPHRLEMKNFLRSPEKYDKDLVHWIRQYMKQEGEVKEKILLTSPKN